MKFTFTSLLVSAAAMSLVLTAPYANAQGTLTKSDVEAIVKKVIQDNPELILNSVKEYQMKQQAAMLSKASQNIVAMQGDLKNNPNSPSAGNPNGDVTVVEFFDYHCHYCKQFYPALAKLMDEDKNVRIVFKEFPILSEDSALAAMAALAVYSIDKSKYFAFHTELMKSSGAFTMDMLEAKAKEVGIDPDAFKKAMANPDLNKEIDHNKELAQSIGISGTPGIIVGTELIPGAVEYDALKAKVAAARQAAKEKRS
jgi:protein-disulfide isomerase